MCVCVCLVQLASECEARVEAVRELDKERASMRVAKAQVASQIAQLQSERDSLSRRLQVLQETLEDERVDRLNASSSQVGCTLVLLGEGVGPFLMLGTSVMPRSSCYRPLQPPRRHRSRT